MSNKTENLILEHLRGLRASVDELRDGQRQIVRRLGSMETHMAGFHSTITGHTDDIDAIQERLARIENRLELAD